MLTIPQTSVFALGAMEFITVSSLKILYLSLISKPVNQTRAHSDYIQGAITKCEDETPHEIPFFVLNL